MWSLANCFLVTTAICANIKIEIGLRIVVVKIGDMSGGGKILKFIFNYN